MKTSKTFSIIGLCFVLGTATQAIACTGITLKSRDNSVVVARTIDWAGSEMNNIYVIVPRGHTSQSLLPDGKYGGKKFTSKYGYVGLGVQQPDFIVDGTNEAGLSAGLFYFPDFGKYRPYTPSAKDNSIADFQFVSWVLSNFSSIDELEQAIDSVRIINIDPTASTTHWRITEPSGRQVILEVIDGVPTFYNSTVGVIANSPNFDWHMTNLDNYVNLVPGKAGPTPFGPIKLRSLSGGTGLLGLPGDFSSPSRFVRAAFLKTYSVPQSTGEQTAMQSFHLLNNFDVPFGTDFPLGKNKFDMPSATQWTISSDISNRVIYYHTMFNRTIRRIDMNKIDFNTVPYQFHPLDETQQETIFDAPIRRIQ